MRFDYRPLSVSISVVCFTLCLSLIMPVQRSFGQTEEPPGFAQPCETRAAWVNPVAMEVWPQTLALAEAMNLNTLLVLVPKVEDFRGGSHHKWFELFTKAAHEAGFSVHGWIANNYWDDYDFTDPEDQWHNVQWAMAVLRAYPYLDGVHFDYIRELEWSPPDAAVIGGITTTIRLSRAAIKGQYPGKCLTAAALPLSGEAGSPDYSLPSWYLDWYNQHWYDPVNRWRPDHGYGTYGFPTPFAYQQDPMAWIWEAEIDAVFSMEYDISTSWWADEARIYKSFLEASPLTTARPRVFAGIGFYKPIHHENPQHVIDKINIGRQIGVRGFSIFELRPDWPESWELASLLTDPLTGPYRYRAPSCLPQSVIGPDEDVAR